MSIGRETIYARRGEGLSELDGQMLLDLGSPDDAELEELFARAEEAESEGRYDEAAACYQRCLAIDPRDSVAAFNRANCLRAMAAPARRGARLSRAIKLDPGFVEAWFNLAGLMSERGRIDAARGYLRKAIALDADYGDAGLQSRQAGVRCRQSRRCQALVDALSRARPGLGMGAHGRPGRAVRRPAVDAEDGRLGCADIQVMPACKWRLSALPVLTYPKVRCAPVLEIHHFGRSRAHLRFRLGLTWISTPAGKGDSGDAGCKWWLSPLPFVRGTKTRMYPLLSM